MEDSIRSALNCPKILFVSFRKKTYDLLEESLQKQYEMQYLQLDEKSKFTIRIYGNVDLCIIEMLRFTDKSRCLISEIRIKSSVPILFISWAVNQTIREKECVQALECGADDYMVSSQSIEEIIKKGKFLIRIYRRIKVNSEIWICGDIKIVADKRQVYRNGRELFFTRREFDIIYYLISQKGRVVTYKEIYEAVWQSEYLFDDDNIMAHIHRIRMKLETDIKKPEYILNVYGVGYRFCGEYTVYSAG